MARTDTTPRPVVCDAGPVIHLDELGCIDLLHDFPQVILPFTVRREIERHRPAALRPSGLSWHHTAPRGPTSPELMALAQLLPLHDGEVEALRVAIERPGALLLTDESAARLAARTLAILVHGTIGVLVRSIRRRQCSKQAVTTILRDPPRRSTLHVKPELLPHVLHVIQTVEQSSG